MTIVSSKEFAANQDKYFDMAIDEEIGVKRGNDMFYLYRTNDTERVYYEPDEDFYRAITMDELLIGVKEDLREMFRNGKQ